MIKLYRVTKKYPHGVVALRNITLEIDKGEFVFLVGPTGAGKSTLLKLIYRAELPTSGDVIVDGKNLIKMRQGQVPYFRRKIGVVFQDFKLLRDRTVFENVAFALRVTGARDIKERVTTALRMVNLLRKKDEFPNKLSGGEQQRVSIARAIVNDPHILITDEPTGNLDPDSSWSVMELLQDLNFRGTTIIMASHNKMIVDKMGKRVVRMESGRIVEDVEKGVY